LLALATVTAVLIAFAVALNVVAKVAPGDGGLVAEVRSSPGELYVLGDRSQIYAYSNRRPERRFFYSVPLAVHQEWGDRMRAELLTCPPDVLVVPAFVLFPVDWVDEVASVYRQRVEFPDGMLYRQPHHTCER
jgi:hypothetical protein